MKFLSKFDLNSESMISLHASIDIWGRSVLQKIRIIWFLLDNKYGIIDIHIGTYDKALWISNVNKVYWKWEKIKWSKNKCNFDTVEWPERSVQLLIIIIILIVDLI